MYRNTPGVGVEYEAFVPAYFALKLNTNENVKDFSIRSNVEIEFGNMDDVIIDIEMKDNTRQGFAVQLKHRERKEKKLIPSNFEAKGNFTLEKYCKAFTQLKDQIKKDYHFILYTNSEYNSTSREQLKNFRIIEDEDSPGRSFLDTSCGSSGIYRFEVNDQTPSEGTVKKEDYEEFFPKFKVYVGQKNFEDLEEEIFGILKDRSAVLRYLDLFRRWHQGRFMNKMFDRKTLNLHLVDIFLSDYVITDRQLSISQNGNLELFENVVRQFDVTVINDLKENATVDLVGCEDSGNSMTDRMTFLLEKYIEECKMDRQKFRDLPEATLLQCMLLLGKNYKIVDRTTQQLDACSKKKILYYFFEELFYIDFNRLSEDSVYRMFDLYQKTNSCIKFVLLGPGVDSSRFSKFTVFKDLKNLRDCDDSLHLEVLRKCQISLQSKDPITLEQLINSCGRSDFIGVMEILQMLQDDFIVGGENEILPVNYIPRKLSSNVLKLDTILKNDFVKNNMLIINFDGKFGQVRHKFEENSIKIIQIQDFVRLSGPPEEDIVISLVNECSMKQFREISEKFDPKSLLHLKMIDPETFVPVIFKTDDSRIFSKTSTEEENVPGFFNNRINLLCAQPGMGKSTMLKVLKNKLSNVWTVMIDLKAHNAFLNTRLPIQVVLAHFLEPSQDDFLEKIKTAFLEQKKLIFFLDGLDELGNESIDNILNYCEELSNLELQVWISSRPSLESKLNSRFYQSCIHIEEMTEEEQKVYILNRLLPKYKEQEVRELTEKLFKNSHIEHNRRLLGIPLQLYMMTQIFLDDEDQYYSMTKNMFVLTKMYKMFFDGRYKHTSDKQDSKNPHLMVGDPEDYFEKYEIIALQFIFDDDIFAKLNLDARRSRRFLEEIKTKQDPLGIVVKVNSEDKPIFEHYTYAEYFACVFLANNFDRAQVFRDHLFSDRYRSLLLMLNVMLAEENPLHLAIIHKDLDQIEAYREDPNIYDKGGRNPLHVAVTNGVKYPGCFALIDSKWWSFTTSRFCQMAKQMKKEMRVMKNLVKFNPLDPDKLFKWNCLDYAFAGGCLLAVELLILPKFEIPNDYLERYRSDPPFASFCTLTGTVNLLSTTLGNDSIPTMTHWLQQSLLHDTITFCFLKKLEMLRFLLQNGVDVDSTYKGKTALQLAVQRKYLEEVTLLLESGASMNVTTKDGDTLLHCVFHFQNFRSLDILLVTAKYFDKFEATWLPQCEAIELVTVLLEKGVPINSSNKMGETALHLAVEAGDLEVVKLLYQRGADINAVTKNISNVLHYAANNTNTELTTFLLNSIRFDVNTRNHDGVAPLVTAFKNGNLNIANLLLDNGADVNFRGNDGMTLLNWAVHTGHYSIDAAVLEKGINNVLNVLSTEDAIPFPDASHIDFGVTELLLEKGADVNILTGEGVHCLQLAVYSGHVEVVKMILDRVDLEQVVWTSEKYSLTKAERNGVLQRDLLLQLTETVRKKRNTPGVGVEYEAFVPAYFALKLNTNENVKDFSIRSNVEIEFGNMDDAIIDIEMKDNTRQGFAIQLKHRERKEKKLIPANFEAKGNFSVEKYCKAFTKLKDRIKKDYHFILYTNSEYNSTSREQLKNFRIIEDEDEESPGRSFFNTSCGSSGIYRFEVNDDTPSEGTVTKKDYEIFFPKFKVYVGQKNFEDLEEEIFGILKNRSAVLRYLDLFRRWHQGRFTNKTFDRKTLNLHLVDIFLSDFGITDRQLSISQNSNLELFEKVVGEFDLTVIDDLKENTTVDLVGCEDSGNLITDRMTFLLEKYIEECKIDRQKLHDDPEATLLQCMLFLGKNYKIVDRTTQKLDTCSRKKILYYFFEELFYIDFNRLSEESVYRMFDLYQTTNNSIKFVLLGPGVDSSRFSKFAVFKDLKNLRDCDDSLHLEVLQKCQISLQSKDPITLEQLINSCGTSDFIGVKEILRMLRDDFIVGGENEILPVNYIPRKLSSNVLKLDTVLKNDFVKNNTLIINFDGKFEQVRHKFEENSIKIIEIQDFVRLSGPPEGDIVISLVNECSMKQFREISKTFDPKSLLHLRLIDPETFVPVILKTEDCGMFTEHFTEEEKALGFFKNRLNILCAQPGMGKTTMFKVLKNQLSTVWTVMVDLKAHNQFLKTKRSVQELLAYFLEESHDSFLEEMKSAFLEEKKLILFLDGVDELDNQCIDNVFDYCEELSNLELQVWISSRPNLESKLTSHFCQSCIHLGAVTTKEQKEYITNRLLGKYNNLDRHLTEKIYKSTHIGHNRRLLGVPLQLYMMTQIFLDDENQYYTLTRNVLVFTKMYKMFFDGRYKQSSDKQDSKNPHLAIEDSEDHFERYEMLALQFLFDDDVFAELNLDTRRSRRFLEKIRSKKDPLGVVVGVTNENRAIFEHHTYAEYFACVFLADNFDKAKILRNQLFSRRYRGVFMILNVMLAEENPLHLAIIYKDAKQIKIRRHDRHTYDKGGRNPLHLAVLNCTKYPGCFAFKDSEWSFTPSRFFRLAKQMVEDADIIKNFIRFDPWTRDDLFDWTCVEYALARGSLFAAELILPRYEFTKQVVDSLERYRNDPPFASFCSLTGALNLLLATLGDNLIPAMTDWSQESLLHDTITFCFFRKLEMVRFLLQKGVHVDSEYKEKTALQLAVKRKYIKLVETLLDFGASTSVTTKDGDTLLHCALQGDHVARSDGFGAKIDRLRCEKIRADPTKRCEAIDLVSLLVKKGVSVNACNNKGETALHLAVATGDQRSVQFLHQRGVDVNAVAKDHSNVLHYAANTEITALLLGQISVDINGRNDDGDTPLLKAVKEGNCATFELLVAKGADVDVVDNNGSTLLHWAASTGDCKIAEALINERIKNIDALNMEGLTPLHVVADKNFAMTELLIEKGADVNVLTGEGVHLLQLAVHSGNVKTAKLILDRVDLSQVVWTPEKYSLGEAEQNGILQRDLLLQLTESVEKKKFRFAFQ